MISQTILAIVKILNIVFDEKQIFRYVCILQKHKLKLPPKNRTNASNKQKTVYKTSDLLSCKGIECSGMLTHIPEAFITKLSIRLQKCKSKVCTFMCSGKKFQI